MIILTQRCEFCPHVMQQESTFLPLQSPSVFFQHSMPDLPFRLPAAAPVANATDSENVVNQFNELLANLRTAGLLAPNP